MNRVAQTLTWLDDLLSAAVGFWVLIMFYVMWKATKEETE